MREKSEKQTFEKAADWIKGKGYSKIKANLTGFESPTSYHRKNGERVVTPDFTAVLNGRKSYFLISRKTDNVRPLISKWRLLEQLAAMKNGKLFLFAPYGHKSFTDRMTKEYGIDAQVISI